MNMKIKLPPFCLHNDIAIVLSQCITNTLRLLADFIGNKIKRLWYF